MKRLIAVLLFSLLCVTPSFAMFEQDMPIIGKVVVMTPDEAQIIIEHLKAEDAQMEAMQGEIIMDREIIKQLRTARCL